MNNDDVHVRDPTHEPSASRMLNHFECVGVSNIASAFFVVVLLPRLFVAVCFKKTTTRKFVIIDLLIFSKLSPCCRNVHADHTMNAET